MTATLAFRRPMAAPIAVGCCLAAGTAYVGAVDPSETGLLPCPYRALTGWWCPGCGMTRATHQLLHGDIAQALRFNALVVLVLAGLAATWATWAWSASGRSVRWVARIPPWAVASAIAVLVAFAVLRNLPGVDGLRGPA